MLTASLKPSEIDHRWARNATRRTRRIAATAGGGGDTLDSSPPGRPAGTGYQSLLKYDRRSAESVDLRSGERRAHVATTKAERKKCLFGQAVRILAQEVAKYSVMPDGESTTWKA